MNYLLVWLVFATIGAQAVYDDGLSRTFYILSAAAHAALPQPCLHNHFTDITVRLNTTINGRLYLYRHYPFVDPDICFYI